jgi:hypothetical protein
LRAIAGGGVVTRVVSFQAGDEIIVEGAYTSAAYVLDRGSVEVYLKGAPERRVRAQLGAHSAESREAVRLSLEGGDAPSVASRADGSAMTATLEGISTTARKILRDRRTGPRAVPHLAEPLHGGACRRPVVPSPVALWAARVR